MYWERVTEEIYLFTSDRYALVNSVAILTGEGLIIVDGLPFPDEARQIARFLHVHTGLDFHTLILTHHHIDHVYGLSPYPAHLDVLAHERCRQKLLEIGEDSLAEARRNDPIFDDVVLRIPNVTFDTGEMLLRAGKKTFRMFALPGHTADNIGIFYEEEEVLITGDAVMAIPIIADGNWGQQMATLKLIKELSPDTLIQGHGEVILRGEVHTVLDRYIVYLNCAREKAQIALDEGWDPKEIRNIPLEDCGLERVPLGIASHQLHIANILSVYRELAEEQG